MSPEFFFSQWERLKIRFGERAMDAEFKRLCASAVRDMSEQGFARAVDVWIGSRKHTDPPRLAEFREANMAEHKRQFDNDVKAAAFNFEHTPIPEVLKRIGYAGCKTVNEAVEVERLRMRIAQADREGEGA